MTEMTGMAEVTGMTRMTGDNRDVQGEQGFLGQMTGDDQDD